MREAVASQWDERGAEASVRQQQARRRLAELAARKQRLVEAYLYERAIDRATYDSERSRLDLALAEAEEAASRPQSATPNLAQALDLAEDLLTNAADRWWHLEARPRRVFQNLLFPRGIFALPDGKFRTPEMCPLFSDLEAGDRRNARLVSPTGFEPVSPP